ncbi:MAG: dnaN [Chlamydiales bacterium]|jgi:DNA polymerase-3 subunit beta|nr:dnaN [Chlamydiales bacterium]
MKFIISRQHLNQLISMVQNIVAQKASIPILSNILIEAVKGEIILTATDLNVGVRCFAEAKVIEEGATTLPAKRFANLIRELTSLHIEMSSSSSDITEIVADSSRFKLHGMNRSEYPQLPDLSGATQIKVKESDLKDMLYRTAFAVSREDSRFVLTGVFMQVQNGRATFVGTDGKRLAKASLPVAVDPSFSGEYIIPLKAVEEILKNLGDENEANLYLTHDKIAVETGNLILISKLLSGDYPDVTRVIPEKTETIVPLHRDELITLLRQVSLFTTDTSQSVKFTFADGELRLTANAMDIGEGKVSMPVNYRGERLEIAFNPAFFLDILRHSKQETVSIGLTDPFNPGLITDAEVPQQGAGATGPLFVLMPMRLSGE